MCEVSDKYATQSLAAMVAEAKVKEPERFARLATPELLADKLESMKSDFAKRAAEMLDKRACAKLLRIGCFDRHNQAYRSMFTELTGVQLPKDHTGTVDTVRAYVGQDTYDAIRKEQEAMRLALVEETRRKEAEQQSAWIEKTVAALRSDEFVSGDDLVEFARYKGIEVHPRTVGMIRKRVRFIRSCEARVVGKSDAQSAFSVHKQVLSTL